MRATDQAGVIRVITDWHQVDLEPIALEKQVGARDRKFADPAFAKAAADHDALGIGPGLALEKALSHIGEFLSELLDRAMNQRGGVNVVAHQRLIQRAFPDRLGGFAAERIVAGLLQRLAQRVQDLSERALAGTVTEKAVVVL